jgi:glutamyl-tRNA synthetase
MKEVRVRFAPSPTGSLHIGGLRTALYNYLFAKKNNGKFIIRIEDTDQSRFVEEAEQYIYNALKWLGLKSDESVIEGGPFTPYKQSERKDIYSKYAFELVEKGLAYLAFDTPEELDEMRAKLKDSGEHSFQYNAATRMSMRNSLSLPAAEVERLKVCGNPYVLRLKVPAKEEIRLNDMIRGWVMVHSSTLDDKVLLKSDGLPTYHLANVVDDYLMKISHVIRGEEWLPSAPTHVLLYKSFGWEKDMPQFAHLPLLLKPSGDGKLSKRDGEMMGFPVFPLEWTDKETGRKIAGFKEEGYLPEALINFLAFLGWNPGTEQELFTLDELIREFSIERIGKSGTRFDINKAKWFNQHYLQKKEPSYFSGNFKRVLEPLGLWKNSEKLDLWVKLVQERSVFESDMVHEITSISNPVSTYDESIVSSKWSPEAKSGLEAFANALKGLNDISLEDAKVLFNQTMESLGIKPGKVLQILRVAITGKGAGPDLMTIIELLGPKEISARIEMAILKFG